MNDKITKEQLVKKILDNDRSLDHSNISEELLHELISGKISKNINNIHDENITIGQRIADKVASFGGSWPSMVGIQVQAINCPWCCNQKLW